MNIIDVHTHAFPDKIAARALTKMTEHTGEYLPVLDGTLNGLLSSMDEAGISLSFLSSIATRAEQARSILEWSVSIRSKRICPLASFHPLSVTWEHELDAIHAAGIPGVKFHPQYQGFAADDPGAFPAYEKLSSLGMFALFHAGYDVAYPGDDKGMPRRFARIRRELPGLIFIAAHLGGWHDWDAVVEHLAGTDIYLDTSFMHEADPALVKKILSAHSRDRILFGSDSPWLSQKAYRAYVESLPLEDGYLEKIMFTNAAGLPGIKDILA